jgi:hypothetical protein
VYLTSQSLTGVHSVVVGDGGTAQAGYGKGGTGGSGIVVIRYPS